VLLLDAPLTFREFMSHETVPLADVFREVLTYVAGRDDSVLFGAQAVNAYCEAPRMTQDVDLLSTNAAELVEDLRQHLGATFGIAIRVRQIGPGSFRLYQVRKPANRHLVDVRQIDELPAHARIEGVPVALPFELAARKVISLAARRGKEKGLSDRLDLHRLLNAIPELRSADGAVADRLRALGADAALMELWREVVSERIEPDDDEGY
jgi:hypothetical protein